MKTNVNKLPQRGFTLIEMIGVLAVIAILAALLIPKIFEAINNSRVSNAGITCQTIKTAIADHYAKFGSIAVDGTIPATPTAITIPYTNFDKILLNEGFIDKPFIVKIGDGTATTTIRLVQSIGSGASITKATDFAYCLSGRGATNETFGVIVEAIITGVNANDAKALNDAIDGQTLGSALGAADLQGRVKYDAIATTGPVYVYLTHR